MYSALGGRQCRVFAMFWRSRVGGGAKFEYQKSSRGVPCERGAYFEVYVRHLWLTTGAPVGARCTKKVSGASRARVVQILRPALGTFGSRMVLPLGRGAQKKFTERPVREWCTIGIARKLRGSSAGAPVRAWCASWKVHGPRGAPVREWRTPGNARTLSRGSGALWGVHGRSRASVVRVLESSRAQGRSRSRVAHAGQCADALAWEWCTVGSSRAPPCERGARPGSSIVVVV